MLKASLLGYVLRFEEFKIWDSTRREIAQQGTEGRS
jgi:hypothetical protein